MKEYQIGQRVTCRAKTGAGGEYNGMRGTISDKMTSAATEKTLYAVDFDGCEPAYILWRGDELSAEEGGTFEVEITFEDNVAVAVLYEKKGDKKQEIHRGHGHFIHEGALGAAQAASYALKRLYYKVAEDEGIILPDRKEMR